MHILRGRYELKADIWSTLVSQCGEFKNAMHPNTVEAKTQELPQQCTCEFLLLYAEALLYTITGEYLCNAFVHLFMTLYKTILQIYIRSASALF